MAEVLHLGDEVELVTDSIAGVGVPRGSIGVIVDDWADGSNDVEIRNPATGEIVARVRAAEGEIVPSDKELPHKEPREHGILFGRGDDLGAPAGDPPSATANQFGGMPWGGTNGPWNPPEVPPEEGTTSGDVPWELRDEPPTGPIFH